MDILTWVFFIGAWGIALTMWVERKERERNAEKRAEMQAKKVDEIHDELKKMKNRLESDITHTPRN
jgi:DNA topoisomerase VI subunit B